MDGVSVETAQGSCSELRERKGRGREEIDCLEKVSSKENVRL